MAEYRICRDKWLGYEVQLRTWYWPFWRMADFSNTFSSLGEAEQFAHYHAGGYGCVKYLGSLPSYPSGSEG